MTTREIQIAKKILGYLHTLDGGQAHALTIHGEIGGLSFCSSGEFDGVLEILDARRALIGVKTEFKGTLFSISDTGEQLRQKMK